MYECIGLRPLVMSVKSVSRPTYYAFGLRAFGPPTFNPKARKTSELSCSGKRPDVPHRAYRRSSCGPKHGHDWVVYVDSYPPHCLVSL